MSILFCATTEEDDDEEDDNVDDDDGGDFRALAPLLDGLLLVRRFAKLAGTRLAAPSTSSSVLPS